MLIKMYACLCAVDTTKYVRLKQQEIGLVFDGEIIFHNALMNLFLLKWFG